MVSSPAVYRRAIFHVLHGGDSQTVGAVVSFLAAVLLNEGLHLDVLDSCGGSRSHTVSNVISNAWASLLQYEPFKCVVIKVAH